MTIQKTGTELNTRYEVIPSRKDTKLTTAEEDEIIKVFKEPAEIIEKMKDKVSTDVEVVSEKDTKLTDTDEEEIIEQ
jgi:hypothetical protein